MGESELALAEVAWCNLIDRFKSRDLTSTEKGEPLPVMRTPLVFSLIGIDLWPIEIRVKTLNKILNTKHKLDPETLKRLLRELADPVMIFKSEHDEGGRDSRIILTGLKEMGSDKKAHSIVAVLTLKKANPGKRYEINELTTVYRKDQSSKQQFTPEEDILDWVRRTYRDGTPMNLLKYINRQRSSEWVKSADTPSMAPDFFGASLQSIPNESDLVTLKKSLNLNRLV